MLSLTIIHVAAAVRLLRYCPAGAKDQYFSSLIFVHIVKLWNIISNVASLRIISLQDPIMLNLNIILLKLLKYGQ